MCLYCHKPTQDFQTCGACKLTNPNAVLDGCIIGFSYTPEIKKLIYKLKFYHRHHIATFLAHQLALCCQTNQTLQEGIGTNRNKWEQIGGSITSFSSCLVTFVPSHRRRHYFVKGYNQSEILATYIAEKLILPCHEVAKKIKHTTSQVSLSREQRQKNLTDAFQGLGSRENTETNKPVNQQKVLIVDDITTTGSTLTELAKTIKRTQPTIQVRGVVLARNNK